MFVRTSCFWFGTNQFFLRLEIFSSRGWPKLPKAGLWWPKSPPEKTGKRTVGVRDRPWRCLTGFYRVVALKASVFPKVFLREGQGEGGTSFFWGETMGDRVHLVTFRGSNKNIHTELSLLVWTKHVLIFEVTKKIHRGKLTCSLKRD